MLHRKPARPAPPRQLDGHAAVAQALTAHQFHPG
jgi:hypothetical protein